MLFPLFHWNPSWLGLSYKLFFESIPRTCDSQSEIWRRQVWGSPLWLFPSWDFLALFSVHSFQTSLFGFLRMKRLWGFPCVPSPPLCAPLSLGLKAMKERIYLYSSPSARLQVSVGLPTRVCRLASTLQYLQVVVFVLFPGLIIAFCREGAIREGSVMKAKATP